MGPAQKSYDVKISTPGMRFSRRRQTGRDFFLPVTQRGSFFEDSSFSNIHKHFDDALKDVLDKWYDDDDDMDMSDRWDDVKLRRSNVFDRYRRLRSRDLKEENQMVTVTSDDTCHKFLLDVHDFLKGDIKVQVVDEETLVIEGHTSTHSFKKSFTLPDQADVENIISVISLEGILTVTVPRMGCEPPPRPTSIPVSVEKTNEASEAQASSSFMKTSEEQVSGKQEESQSSRIFQRQCQEQSAQEATGEYEIPIMMDETRNYSMEHQEHQETQGIHQDSLETEAEQKVMEDKEVIVPITMEKTERNESSTQTEEAKIDNRDACSSFKLKSEEQNMYDSSGRSSLRCSPCPENIYTSVGEEEDYSIPVQIETSRLTPDTERRGRDRTPNRASATRQFEHRFEASRDSDEEYDSQKLKPEKKKVVAFSDEDDEFEKFEPPVYPKGSQFLPIVRKGGFGEDYFFEDVRQSYGQAVKDVLEMAHEWTGKTTAMRDYRNLRDKNLKLENQAFCVSDDQQWYKVVIDVQDFTGGDVTVQLVDGKELVVEGQAEKQEATRLQRLSFIRRFALPDLADREAIIVALSSDGILAIVAPKRSLRRKKRGSSCDRRDVLDERSWREKYGLDRFEESESSQFDRKPSLHSFLNQF